jgi:hypothetical protein
VPQSWDGHSARGWAGNCGANNMTVSAGGRDVPGGKACLSGLGICSARRGALFNVQTRSLISVRQSCLLDAGYLGRNGELGPVAVAEPRRIFRRKRTRKQGGASLPATGKIPEKKSKDRCSCLSQGRRRTEGPRGITSKESDHVARRSNGGPGRRVWWQQRLFVLISNVSTQLSPVSGQRYGDLGARREGAANQPLTNRASSHRGSMLR